MSHSNILNNNSNGLNDNSNILNDTRNGLNDNSDILNNDVDDLGEQLSYLDQEIQHIKNVKNNLHKIQHRIGKHTDSLICHKKRTDRVYLDVIAVLSNPVEYNSRYNLFKEFCVRMRKEPQVRLFTVELQHRNKPFITDANIKLRTSDELWHKENMINIATQNLPRGWEYMAWIDADIEFLRKDWVAETIRQLQHYDIVQLFSNAINMGPNNKYLEKYNGFCYQWHQQQKYISPQSNPYKEFWHTGYGFAIRREMYDKLGGLIEFPILGAADHHMCKAWIGRISESFPSEINPNYKTLCENYQKRCDRHLQQNIGYVEGTIIHYWHGKKADRKYRERWDILTNNDYDPLMDIKKDSNNLWILEGNKHKFRDDLRYYFRARNEDSVDVE